MPCGIRAGRPPGTTAFSKAPTGVEPGVVWALRVIAGVRRGDGLRLTGRRSRRRAEHRRGFGLHFPPSNVLVPRLTEPHTLLATPEDVRTAATTIALSAQRVLTILTHDLESAVFEYPPFVSAVQRFVLGPRFTKVRVLVLNPGRIMYSRHEFIALARKLTSYIEIRNAQGTFRDNPCTYMIADERSTLYRLQHGRWDGTCELGNPAVARRHLDHFDVGWNEVATPRTQALTS